MIKYYFSNTITRPLFTFCLLTAIVFSCPVYAQDMDSRLQRIENEIQTLSRAVFKGEELPPGMSFGEGASATQTANIELRLQQIERELRSLTGQIEQQNFQNRQFEDRIEKTVAAMELRIAELERQRGGSVPAISSSSINNSRPYPYDIDVPPQHVGSLNSSVGAQRQNQNNAVPDAFDTRVPGGLEATGSAVVNSGAAGQLGTLRQPSDQPVPEGADVIGTTTVPSSLNSPIDSYERAFSFLRDRDYDQAEQAFSSFLNRYSDHDLAGNAKYWLGETYYVRNDFERAARVFAEAYQEYPKGTKGPDNLLKLGMSLSGMGKTQDACLTYGQLQKEYPAGALPILMRAEKEMEKLGCSQF